MTRSPLVGFFFFFHINNTFTFFPPIKAWNVLALDGSNWQRIDLFDFQRDIEV